MLNRLLEHDEGAREVMSTRLLDAGYEANGGLPSEGCKVWISGRVTLDHQSNNKKREDLY